MRPSLTFQVYAVVLAAVGLGSTSARADDPTIAFEKYKLANGLTVILSEDHRLPQVAVDIWYHVGAANQTPGKSGFAHLFEHMMFSGSKHVPKGPFSVLEAIGTTAGNMANGTTDNDRTNYFEVVAANELPTALWLEADRMGYLLDAVDAQKLAIQRDVVSNERRQSYENQPYGVAQLALCDNLYPKPHPYYQCVIGEIAEIQSAQVDDLKAFFKTWYAPSNASLVIVGDFTPAEARTLVDKYFGSLPTVAPVTRPQVPQPRLDKEVRLVVPDKIAQVGQLVLAWPSVTPFHPDEAALDVLSRILTAGRTSRLYRALVFDKPVASDMDSGNNTLGLGGYFEIDVTAQRGRTVAEVGPLVDALLADLQKNGVTQDEVDRAKRNLVAQRVRAVERLAGFGGKADILNLYEMWTGDPGGIGKDLARYRAVTPADVQAAARKYLTANRLVLDVEPANAAVSR